MRNYAAHKREAEEEEKKKRDREEEWAAYQREESLGRFQEGSQLFLSLGLEAMNKRQHLGKMSQFRSNRPMIMHPFQTMGVGSTCLNCLGYLQSPIELCRWIHLTVCLCPPSPVSGHVARVNSHSYGGLNNVIFNQRNSSGHASQMYLQ